MVHGQAFFVVGHKNWGKSQTLKALTGAHQVRRFTVGTRTFWIRRMSNDDRESEWLNLVRGLDPSSKPSVILTMCPTTTAYNALRELSSRYALFFWIIQQSYGDERVVSLEQEQSLRALGTTDVLTGRVEAGERAAAFRRFIEAHP